MTRSRTLALTDPYAEQFHGVRRTQVSRAWSAASSDDIDSFSASASSRCWSPTRDDDDVHVTEELVPQQQQQHSARCSTQTVASSQTIDEFCDCDDDDGGGGDDMSAENGIKAAVTAKKTASSPPGISEMQNAASRSGKCSDNADVNLSTHYQQKMPVSTEVKGAPDSRKTEGSV